MNYSSEKYTYTDAHTGAQVTRLTSWRANSNHLYFTNNCFYDNGRRIVFESDRGNAHNLFSMELESGEIEQLTDLPVLPYPKGYSLLTSFVDPINAVCCFFMEGSLTVLDIKTKELRKIYTAPKGYVNHISSITADGKYVLTSVFEDKLPDGIEHDVRTIYNTQPHSMILRIPINGGPA